MDWPCAPVSPPSPPLQRDFGLYVVNLFDTGQAARVLSLPSAGLAFLLDHYCGVKVWESVLMKCGVTFSIHAHPSVYLFSEEGAKAIA